MSGDLDGKPPYSVYRVELKRKTLPDGFHIRFDCEATEPAKTCREFARVERTEQGWVAWHPSTEEPTPQAAHVVVNELKSVNGVGAMRLNSDTVGDELNRSRHLAFCLTSSTGATLFGGAFVDVLYGRHKSIEPEVMQLLRSIEFIDDATGHGSAPSGQ